MPTTPPLPDRTNGQTIDQSWFNLPKTVLYTLWDKVMSLQNEIQTMSFDSNALLDHLTLPAYGVRIIPIHDDIILVDAEIFVIEAGSAGSIEVGFSKSSDLGATWTSVLTTNPTRGYAAGAGQSSNGVVNPLTDTLAPGDLLRIDIIQLQTAVRNWSALLTFQRN